MSELGWLPRGLEQSAPPLTQPLPVSHELTYRVGGDRVVYDAVATNFNPHFWLFELGTAKWRVGYDTQQRPVYEITLGQYHVFHVLLVDYWKPPQELWRRDQLVRRIVAVVLEQDEEPVALLGSVDADGYDSSGASDVDGYVPTGVEG